MQNLTQKFTMKPGFKIIVLTPPGLNDPTMAIAASRAGEWGVLNLEYGRDLPSALAAVSQLGRQARNECGIKISSTADESFVQEVTNNLPELIRIVVLTCSKASLERLPDVLETFHRARKTVVLEVTTAEQADLGVRIGVDGLIAKGHEAGGRVGEETAFILLQRILKHTTLPVWVQGGIGLHTAAACYAAGAAGVVLDAQMALTRESGLPDSTKALIERMDGSESICLGAEIGLTFRIYNRAGLPVVDELRKTAQSLIEFADTKKKIEGLWHAAIESRIGWESAERQIMPLGQDAAFAATLAKTYGTVGGILQAIRDSVNAHVRTARKLRPLDEGAPLAQAHKTRYPIVQGPMTRVSDTAEFAARVAEGGALPFLALALLRAKEVEALLEETRRSLGDRSWGVGILGFVPLDLRQEQLEAIRKVRPPFALIAGGRPDQALVLEEQGIPTYLHVPSPGLLKMFLENGARRFVFEGRECGGHVGPRTSFVLWNLMIDVLLESSSPKDLADCHILFAGGIHDALSASMVATMAAPLAERGVRIGALLGTAYLFTEEAVAAKAIVPGFQKEAARCDHTVLLESGPGHAIRCVDNPYADFFNREKKRLFKEGRSPEQVREALEELNLGRLRIASKGFVRNDRYGKDPDAPKLSLLGEEEQRAQGMYMIGQVAAFRDGIGSIGELHYDVAVRGSERLRDLAESGESSIVRRSFDRPSDIAIVGMGCLLPGAQELRTFWENIVNKVNGITEVPKDRWDWRLYYHSDQKARDKVSSRWGGFLGDIPFDPMRYGMPPSSLDSIEPLQLLTLEVVRQALTDAGYGVPSVGLAGRPFHRERASVILGVGGGIADLGQQYAIRSALPMLFENPSPDIWNRLPEWTEDSFAGILPNVAAGRVANRFDLGGVNYTVDAACASSLAALYMAVRELESGSSDMVIVGGADTIQNPFAFLCFSKTHALSPRGRCRTFDETADGIAISEGLAVLVVKRLEDAERDGDRIYAVIKSVAGSSDGRDKGLTAPRPEGQIRALERAYAKAGFSPATVELIEAHGTGTVAGDQAEAESLIRLLSSAGTPQQNCAIGSVKSMIGHTKSTAGIVGILKAALSLHFGVLPPTIGVEKPNSKVGFRQSPIYINAESRPWIGHPEHPRRAGVSSFGFGGTNFHAVLEEYDGASANSAAPAALRNWPAELFVWGGESTRALLAALEPVERALARREKPALPDLADAVYRGARKMKAGSDRYRLAVVATSREDLEQKLKAARTILSRSTPEPVSDPRGIYFSEARREGKIAFLFSGQGSQYPDMLKDLAIHFPEARKRFEQADRVLSDRYPRRLSSYVFPPPRFFPEEEKASQQALTQTNVAQPAIGAADMALFALMKEFGIAPDMTAGHSYGEYAALCAAGAFDEETLYRISEARGRIILEAAAGRDLGTMAAVEADREAVSEALKTMEGIFMANLNSPKQTIVSGTRPAVERAIEDFKAKGVGARPIPVACAFHSPLVAPAKEPFRAFLETLDFKPPRIEVFSNSLAAPHTKDPSAIVANLAEHLTRPVEFVREIEAMYAAGARTFVEIGPRNVLTALCQQILGDRPHRALATDSPGRSGLTQLEHVLAQLFIAGLAVNLDPLFRGRAVARLDLDAPEMKAVPEVLSPTTWLVNGGRARPMQNATHRAKGVARDSMADKLNTRQVEITKDDGKKEDKPQTVRAADMNPPEIQSPSRAPIETSAHQNIKPAEDKEWAMDPRVGPDGDASQVMIHYQRLMARFLDTQKNVMLAYLRSAPPPSPGQTKGAAAAPSQAVTVNPAPRRVQPMVAPPIAQPVVQDTQASPGSAPALASPPPSPSDIVTAPAKPAELGREDLTERLVQIVSDRTGYPREMLDLDSNIEADLGIDSIKRVEILGAFQRSLPAERRLPPGTMEKLTAIKTMRGIIDWALNAFVDARSVSVPPSSASEKTAGSVHPAGLGREDLTDRLVQIVSDRTGYPREMLDLDSNIEADLGIDSIKRVEILGAFQRSLPAERRLPPGTMEKLTAIKTMRGIIDWVLNAMQTESTGPTEMTSNPSAPASALISTSKADGRNGVPRYLMTSVDAPLSIPTTPSTMEGVFLITDDGNGFSQSVGHRLESHGARAVILRMGTAPGRLEEGIYDADLTRPEAVQELVQTIRRQYGPIKGLIHLLPLQIRKRFEEMELGDWRAGLNRDVKALFHLAKSAGPDLKETRGWMVAATASSSSPGQGGIAGLIKTAAIEWPSVRCKVIDLDATQSASDLAGQLIAEMASPNGPVELNYQGSHRLIPQPRLAPADPTGQSSMTIGTDSVILITGGARGITAKIACDLARRYRPTLWIVGRSPRPAGEETEETRGIDNSRDLKAALLNRLRRDGTTVTPAQVEAAYRRLCQDREIRTHLAEMEKAGARVHYEPVDVRDERAYGDLIDRIYQSQGRIDGVIHGAGIIEDKLILDKDPESFYRVFDTKTDSAFVLSRRLRPSTLKFLVFFASVAGRFGNKGQGDYAAANEVLNKLAIYLDRQWPTRVVSINWGPWATGGMVSPGLERELQERGMQLIPSEEGLRKFHDELLGGRKGEVEVIVGDGPWASSVGSQLIGTKTQEGG